LRRRSPGAAPLAVYIGLGAKLEAGAHQLHAGRAHEGARLHRSSAAVHDQFRRSLFGTGPASEVCGWTCSSWENTDYWLAPTAEVPVTNLFPRRNAGIGESCRSSCARIHRVFAAKQAPTGAMCAGIIRQHQFQKVGVGEVHLVPSRATTNWKKLTANAERILQKARSSLPDCSSFHRRYRIFRRPRPYDIEVVAAWGRTIIRKSPPARIFEAFSSAGGASIRHKPAKGKSRVSAYAKRPAGWRSGVRGVAHRRELPANGTAAWWVSRSAAAVRGRRNHHETG